MLARLQKGPVGPTEIEQARQLLPEIADQADRRDELLQISRYVLSVRPETYQEVLGHMLSNPVQARLAATIDGWGSELDAENRKLLMMFLMAAEPVQAESPSGRLELLKLGIYCGLPETQKVLGAHAADELLQMNLSPAELLRQARQTLSACAAAGGGPVVLAAVVERTESPALRERLKHFHQQALTCQGMEAHQVLDEAWREIERFHTFESEARALVDSPSHNGVLECDGQILVGGNVLRKKPAQDRARANPSS